MSQHEILHALLPNRCLSQQTISRVWSWICFILKKQQQIARRGVHTHNCQADKHQTPPWFIDEETNTTTANNDDNNCNIDEYRDSYSAAELSYSPRKTLSVTVPPTRNVKLRKSVIFSLNSNQIYLFVKYGCCS